MTFTHPKVLNIARSFLALIMLMGISCEISMAQNNKKGIYFSHPSGFYDEAFELSVSSENPTAELYFTIDGSDPTTSITRATVGNSATIRIDPEIDTIRPTTPAFILRVIAMLGDSAITEHISATYIFIDKVKTQKYPGYGWPLGSANGQFIDLNVDPDVVTSPLYEDVFDEALLAIPSISVVTDNGNLFDRSNGIYVNAHGHGSNWERPCSIELINPDGSEGFMENAGIRIRGGWSRHSEFPKHAFRMFFRSEYGTDKLRFPLFEDEGVAEFDKFDLRCAQNYAWPNSEGAHNTFIREVFSRDSQRDMGQPYTRSRYYHLYLNGMYWGLYQTQERSEARYAESYFGGDSEDYDVVKVNVENYVYEMEATDGNLDAWQKIWNLSLGGFNNNSNYFQLSGKNSIGNARKNSEVLVDIDNLIDYMTIIFYTGNFDSPVTQFRGNDFPNNIYAIYNREDHSKGFMFFAHDAEHSLMTIPITAGNGLNENRVNIGAISGPQRMEISEFKYFNPHWLHHQLTQNEEYKIRFADRAAKHLSHGGVFTEESALHRFNARAKEIDMAIIGESARWGDTRNSTAFTKDNAWIPELDNIRNSFFPARTNIVIRQLKDAGLYAQTEGANFVVADTLFDVAQYMLDQEISITLENPNNEGIIFYSLDGTDPRIVGGEIKNDALQIEHGGSLTFDNSATLNVRILEGANWSALRTLELISENDDLSNLKITEIHYHPKELINGQDTLKSKDLEFIEFKNIGETSLNLSGITIDSAVSYTFPENTILPPGQFYVVASSPGTFYDFNALEANGNFKGNLSNSGEQLVVVDRNGNTLIDLTFIDSDPWPDKADGDGPSLASVHFNPTESPASPEYWRISIYEGGTPFRDDELVTAVEELSILDNSIKVYPNPAKDQLHVTVPSIEKGITLNLRIYDLSGREELSEEISNDEDISITTSKLSAGLKILTIQKDNLFFSRKLVIEN